jgi:DNA-binding XRE family transcriptional regulator
MVPEAASRVGAHIVAARQRRGLARKTLADLVGRSEEWLRQIEKGQRRLDSIECAIRIADVLRMSDLLRELGLQPGQTERPGLHPDLVQPVRDALTDSVTTLAFVKERAAWHDAERTLDSDVTDAWSQWLGGVTRYTSTMRVLPRLVRGAVTRLQAGARTETHAAALAAYHLACSVLIRVGETQLAWLAADRAFGAAERDGAPDLIGASAWYLCRCYMEQGLLTAAGQFAAAAANRLPGPPYEQSGGILWGALGLLAAEAAARLVEPQRAAEILGELHRAADRSAIDESVWHVPFGPTEVGICAVQVAIALGRSGEALRLASHLEIPDGHPADQQARHYLPLAHLYLRRNEDVAAVFALNKVATISPEDIRYDVDVHQALDRLQQRNNKLVRRDLERLSSLARIA